MVTALFGLCLAGALMALAYIDCKSFTLPDILTLPLITTGLVFAYTQDLLIPALIGALAGYLIFVAFELFYKYVRRYDGLGRGDAKLLAAGGAWCGWSALPFIVLIASAFGLVHALLLTIKNKKTESITHIPFGPYLAIGIFLIWLGLFVLP